MIWFKMMLSSKINLNFVTTYFKHCIPSNFSIDRFFQARKLRAQCYLQTAQFNEAEREAARILVWDPYDDVAMLVRAEALYLQCKVIL